MTAEDLGTGCTVAALLGRADLALRLVSGVDELPAGALDRPVLWTHSSDLRDPTPFLSPGLALLTTGSQLPAAEPAVHRRYVGALAESGVVAVAFGIGVVHDAVPPALVRACREASMALLEVPYATPFIAVTRASADLVAAHGYASRTWELDAHRAIAAAALRADPVRAVLAELSVRLHTWIGLCDASGRLTRSHPEELRRRLARELSDQLGVLLERGGKAAAHVRAQDRRFVVQTLGRSGRLRGALLVETDSLDLRSRNLLATVVAMLGIAGENQESMARAQRRLGQAVLAALLAGQTKLARQLARGSGGLPKAPVRIAVTAPGPHVEALRTLVDLHADPTRTFLGETDSVIAIVTSDVAGLTDLAARSGGRFGVSLPARYDGVTGALRQARTALERGRGAVTLLEDVTPSGVLATLGPDAVLVARMTLDPLLAHDAEHGTELVRTLRTWLEHGTEYEGAARALGVHRHTVRARIAVVEKILGRDLAGFVEQAELWAALAALDVG